MADATIAATVAFVTGSIGITTDPADSGITLDNRHRALNVYLDAPADGTFGSDTSAANQVTLPARQWIEVWRREPSEHKARATGRVTVSFAAASGTPVLEYRVTS